MNRTLIIVDGQYDFMEGGKLPVQGATKALNNVVKYLDSGEISTVIITQDWHDGLHESFKEQGGQWPEHCVAGTHGAEIYKPIEEAIKRNNIYSFRLKKGMVLEQYTAFDQLSTVYSHLKEFKTTDYFTNYILFHEDEIVEICGIAGDVCVMNTAVVLKELNPVIIDNLTASIDYDTFRNLADINRINIIEI